MIHHQAAVALSGAWAFGFIYGMLWAINRLTAVHVARLLEEQGPDAGLLGERAYFR